MKLHESEGLWSTGRIGAEAPLVAVLELDGAVLSWVIDDPAATPELTFTDVRSADWLYRIVGDAGHVAVLSSVGPEAVGPAAAGEVDLAGVQTLPGALDPLRRLAVGHWLRRWWPASARDGVVALDRALLDAEVALLTDNAQEYLSAELVDSEVNALLAPLASELATHLRDGDPRVVELVTAAVDVAAEVGVDATGWEHLYAAREDGAEVLEGVTRDDFALAAGQSGVRGGASIASGTASVNWAGVPPGIFDAAEGTVDWSVEQSGNDAIAVIRVALSGGASPAGIRVALRAGSVSGSGVLDGGGAAALALSADGQPLTESTAWVHDWASAVVTVGADVDEVAETRQRVRAFARSRLSAPGADAYLAEILAAESDY